MQTSLTISPRSSSLDDLLDSICADLSDKTARKYRRVIREFLDWLGPRFPDKRTMGYYRKHLEDRNLKPATIRGNLTAVRKLLDELIDYVPSGEFEARFQLERARKVKGPKGSDDSPGEWFSKRQAQQFLDIIPTDTLKGKRDKALYGMFLNCGPRVNELINLTVGDLIQTEGYHAFTVTGKFNKVRTVIMPNSVRIALDTWLESPGRVLTKDSIIFSVVKKGGIVKERKLTQTAIYKQTHAYCMLAKLPIISVHDLRRTAAHLAYRGGKGADLIAVQQMLGHENIATTQQYLKAEFRIQDAAPLQVGLKL